MRRYAVQHPLSHPTLPNESNSVDLRKLAPGTQFVAEFPQCSDAEEAAERQPAEDGAALGHAEVVEERLREVDGGAGDGAAEEGCWVVFVRRVLL